MIASGGGKVRPGDLSRRLSYNGEYLNQVAKRYAGRSLQSLCDSAFLHTVQKRLVDTKEPVGDILSDLGITNRSHFYRKFAQHYGATPLKYRARMQAEGGDV